MIVYSTCSVHAVENEDAVDDVIATSPGWKTEAALPWWHRRGLPSARCADDVVRTTLEDRTIGFFVSRLVRTDGEDAGELQAETERVQKLGDHEGTVDSKAIGSELSEQNGSRDSFDEEAQRKETEQSRPSKRQKTKGNRKSKRVVVEEETGW